MMRKFFALFLSLSCLAVMGCEDEKTAAQPECDGSSDCQGQADPCDNKCKDNQTCENGECKDKVDDPCAKCDANQTCENGECKDKVEDPCAKCDANQICENGECKDKVEDPCAKCDANQICENGECKDKDDDPCAKCDANQICVDGECKDKDDDPCTKCDANQICENGECKDKDDDPCAKCDANQICENGECKDKDLETCKIPCQDNEVCKDGKCVMKVGAKKCSGDTLLVWDGYQYLEVEDACGVEVVDGDSVYATYSCVAGELKSNACNGYQACGNEGGRVCSADLRIKEGAKCPSQKNFKKCSWDGKKVLLCNGQTYEEFKVCDEGTICMYDLEAINNKYNCVIR